MPPHELAVPPEAAGERLDTWLARALPGRSRADAAHLIDDGAAVVDGRARPKSYRLKGGERVALSERPATPPPAIPAPPTPRIAWENDDLIVIDKPAGLVVHPAPGHRGTTLVDLLAERAGADWKPL